MKINYSCVFIVLLWPIISHAQLNFPASLTNEFDLAPLDASAREVLVLIHGWNPDGNQDSFRQGIEWNHVRTNLMARLEGSGKKLVLYHWENDANTGPIFDGIIGTLFDPAQGYGNATVAAIRAQQHGNNLGRLLQLKAPDLRTVHFIAHSAGSWAAQQA